GRGPHHRGRAAAALLREPHPRAHEAIYLEDSVICCAGHDGWSAVCAARRAQLSLPVPTLAIADRVGARGAVLRPDIAPACASAIEARARRVPAVHGRASRL